MPYEWVLEGSKDGSKWTQLHYHQKNNDLITRNSEKNYLIDNSN